MLFKKFSFYLAIAGILGTVWLVRELRQTPPRPNRRSNPRARRTAMPWRRRALLRPRARM